MPRTVHGPIDYHRARRLWKKCRYPERGKPIAANTRLHEGPNDSFWIRFWNTPVLGIHPNGYYTLNAGNWSSPTTRERINRYTPGHIHVYQRNWRWYVSWGPFTVLFENGMSIY